MKPFMVTQLQIAFERERLLLSPYDEVLFKQLIDYEVVRIGSNGQPTFTSENEHFVDALGLANLAFVLEFPELTGVIQTAEIKAAIAHSSKSIGAGNINSLFRSIETSAVPTGYNKEIQKVLENPDGDRPNDRQRYVKVPMSYRSGGSTRSSWGARSSGLRGGGGGRSMW